MKRGSGDEKWRCEVEAEGEKEERARGTKGITNVKRRGLHKRESA